MTKRRVPASFQDAVATIGGFLTYPVAAEAVGKAERTVRNWSDPDTGALPTIEDAVRLDAAFIAAGGGDPPMLAAYAMRLERASMASAGAAEVAASMKAAVREGNEAVNAMFDALERGGDRLAREVAAREALEAADAFKSAAQKLVSGGGKE
ncbi:hypothetical protein CA606_18415 [Caulobacter vibrioides]|uniref:Uncharacterized protein n=1 Tax=Caulobacter vibrioides TaxID=155892 RepID=A0A290MQV5_CAUVI|nr:hypothetical protein [Caulobacter vibrioides]ATC34146.1 hypothetical protein CA606_18415 [Caulobacter vibrioides]